MAIVKSDKVLHNRDSIMNLVGAKVDGTKIIFEDNDNEIIILDVETSGLDPMVDKVVQFSAIKYKAVGGKLEEIDRIDLYINQPEYDENKIIAGKNGDPDSTFGELTGITNDLLSVAPTEAEAFPDIKAFLGNDPVFICYNTPFDYKFMCQMYIRNGSILEVKDEKLLDVFVMAKDLVSRDEAPELLNSKGEVVTDKSGKPKKTWKLSYITTLYGLDKSEKGSGTLEFHSSINDVVATGRLLNVFIDEYKEQMEAELIKPVYTRTRAKIDSISYWPGWRGYARYYINCTLSNKKVSYYFDVRKKVWGEKTEGIFEQTLIDELKQDVYELLNIKNEDEFSKFSLPPDESFPIIPSAEFLSRY